MYFPFSWEPISSKSLIARVWHSRPNILTRHLGEQTQSPESDRRPSVLQEAVTQKHQNSDYLIANHERWLIWNGAGLEFEAGAVGAWVSVCESALRRREDSFPIRASARLIVPWPDQ